MTESQEAAQAAVEALNALRDKLNAPAALADYGFTAVDIPEATQRVLKAVPSSNPVTVTDEDITALLTAALNGTTPAPATPSLA